MSLKGNLLAFVSQVCSRLSSGNIAMVALGNQSSMVMMTKEMVESESWFLFAGVCAPNAAFVQRHDRSCGGTMDVGIGHLFVSCAA